MNKMLTPLSRIPMHQTPQPSSLRLVTDGNLARVVDGESELAEFANSDIFMAGKFLIRGLRFQPDGKRRISNLLMAWEDFVPVRHPQKADVQAETTTDGLKVLVKPDTQGGVADVEETLEWTPDRENTGWMVDRHCKIRMRTKVKPAEIARYSVIKFPDPEGKSALWWQIDDPNFENNFGPAVPMRDDWIGNHEPYTGPDSFRRHWRKGVQLYFYQEPSGKLRTIRFHRGLTFCLTRQNRRAFPIRKGGGAGVLNSDGTGTLYEFTDRRQIYSHICEWGFDVHFFQKIGVNPQSLTVPEGHIFESTYRMREVNADKMKVLLQDAVPLEPSAEEWKLVENVPIYEEPVNHFRTSWKEDKSADAWAWAPGPGARWDRKVGKTKPGSLHLVVDQPVIREMTYPAYWVSPKIGPTNFMNPLVPRARYRFSGFVRGVSRAMHEGDFRVSLSVEFMTYAGPGTFAQRVLPAEVFTATLAETPKPGKWAPIEVVTGPINGNVLGVILKCELSGHGEAWFDELRFEKC